MKRVTFAQEADVFTQHIFRQRRQIAKFGDQLSSGLEVQRPGDTSQAGTITQFQHLLARTKEYKTRIGNLNGVLSFQDNVIEQAMNVLARAKEIGIQAANESNAGQRASMAEEVASLRDELVQSLANSKYKGSYIYGGLDNDDPPFDAATYTNPATGPFSQRYIYDAEDGSDLTRTVSITDNLSVTANTPGDQVFSNAIHALEILGRSLAGYSTTLSGGVPTGAGTAYTDTASQTTDITTAIDLIESARSNDLMVERVRVAGKLQTLDSASTILDAISANSNEVLNRIQAVDPVEKATQLTEAQNLLNATLTVTGQVLSAPSLLDYL